MKNLSRLLAFACLAPMTAASQSFPSSTDNPRLVLTAVPNTSHANMGLAFLSDGRMLMLAGATNTSPGNGAMGQGYITPPDGNQALYVVSGLNARGALSNVTVTKILDSLTGPPPGVVVVNDTVYVQDRTAFYRVNSLSPANGTSKAKNATRIINAPTLDSNFTWARGESGHQYVFTPQYHEGRFYAAYSASIIVGGTSNAPPTSTYSGALLSWSKDTIVPAGVPNLGFTREAGGLRSPNGLATNGEYMLTTDNQGSFNPGNAIRMFTPGQPLVTYGTRQSTAANATAVLANMNTLRNWAEDLPYLPPLIWVPWENGPSRSLSQPAYLDHGPYKGHWIMGDATRAGMSRVFVDDVDNSGRYQASFHFLTSGVNGSNGRAAGKAINRIALAPDSAVYVGTILNLGNWPSGSAGPVVRMTFRDTSIFEILTVRSRKSADGGANGVEVFFSEPVDPAGATPAAFSLQQFNFRLGATYGCDNTVCRTRAPAVAAVSLSQDNRKAFLSIVMPDTSIGAAHIGTLGVGNNPLGIWGSAGAQDRTLHVTVNGLTSASGKALLHNQAWMGWNYQAQTRFNPADASLIPSALGPKLSALPASRIKLRSSPGVLEVDIGPAGAATLSLYGANGALRARQSGSTGSFRFDTRALGRGLHVLRVKQGSAVYSRRVML